MAGGQGNTRKGVYLTEARGYAPGFLFASSLPHIPGGVRVGGVERETTMIKPIYLELFDDEDDVMKSFEIADLDGHTILLAWYEEPESYSWEAFVLTEKDGVLYEVNADHCSCNGLEGQWEPEVTTAAALRHHRAESYRDARAYDVGVEQVLIDRGL